MFLAGVSAYLQRRQGKSEAELSLLLLTRGLWLMVLDAVVITGALFFCFSVPLLNVFWAIGLSMALMAALVHLPVPAILAIATLLIVGHDRFDAVQASTFGRAAPLWTILHQGGPVFGAGHRLIGLVVYPVVSWVGVMALGYCFGRVTVLPPHRRQRVYAGCGAALVVLFLALRAVHGYGDPNQWTTAQGHKAAILSFLDLEKYPPSLQYCSLFLGLPLLILAAIDALLVRGRALWLRSTFAVYGRVPLAFFVARLYLIHGLALLICMALGHSPHLFLSPLNPVTALPGPPAGFGFHLPGVYAMWLVVVGLLYLPMRRYAAYKQRHREKWWLSYL